MSEKKTKGVLIVDDDEVLLEVLVEQIKELGYLPIEARDGQDAAELLDRGFVPDIILCDVRMPFINGMGLLTRAVERLPLVPFIFMSGYINTEILLEALRCGAWDFLEKPFKQRQLAQALVQASFKAERLRRLLAQAA